MKADIETLLKQKKITVDHIEQLVEIIQQLSSAGMHRKSDEQKALLIKVIKKLLNAE